MTWGSELDREFAFYASSSPPPAWPAGGCRGAAYEKGVVSPALFKPELLMELHPRPQHCLAALHTGCMHFNVFPSCPLHVTWLGGDVMGKMDKALKSLQGGAEKRGTGAATPFPV